MGELKLSDVSVAALLPDVSCLTAILMQDCKKICVNMYKKDMRLISSIQVTLPLNLVYAENCNRKTEEKWNLSYSN
ncbi:hypothetical protein DW810_04155 [Phocaeicola vulgatus]|nr:hypothetical protein DXD33_14660 [Phocaeicola vulgatus]RGK60063.1 hypothetical protein DXD01_16230 [Phocaeicola vulgatus]RHD15572.1 hypothetical protein DW810_04155 [Phocaeicola vulgatus]